MSGRCGLLLGLSLSAVAIGMPLRAAATGTGGDPDESLRDIVRRADAQVLAGRLEAAAAVYDRVLDRVAAAAPTDAALVHLNRGIIRYRWGRLEEALADFDAGTASEEPEVRRRCLFNRARVLVDLARRSAPDRRAPGPLRPEEALGLLVKAQRDIVEAAVIRPPDRALRESLQAVSEEIRRWQRWLPARSGEAGAARAGAAGSTAGDEQAASRVESGSGPGAGSGSGRRSPSTGVRRETAPAAAGGRVQIPDLGARELDALRERLRAISGRARAAERRRQAADRPRTGRDW